jgi:hypothetical protein
VDPGSTTVLWRLYRAPGPFDSAREGAGLAQGRPNRGDRIRAVVLPGGPPFTLAFLANEEMDRVENYDSIDLAVFRADEIKRGLLEEDWKED